jgi:hypothetical protein
MSWVQLVAAVVDRDHQTATELVLADGERGSTFAPQASVEQ